MTTSSRSVSGARRPWRLSLLLLTVVTGLVLSTVPVRGLSPAADAGVDPDDVCWANTGPCLTTYDPPNLLGPDAYAGMTPSQARGVRALEQKAVDLVLDSHQLPASDRTAVRTWGRTDAQAALWALVVEALQTPAGERTPDQVSTVAWISRLVHEHTVASAEQAGAQYASWAGLDLARYWRLVHHTDGVVGVDGQRAQELSSFLGATPSPYDVADTAQATSGFCRFRPPAPYTDDYSASDNPQCFTPCTSPFGCTPDTPDYDQFVSWGAATAQAQRFSGGEFAVQAWSLKAAATFGAIAAGALVGSVVGVAVWWFAVTSGSLLAGTVSLSLLATWGIVAGASAVSTQAAFVAGVQASTWAAALGAAAAGAMLVVALAVVTSVLEGLKVDQGAKVPGQIADLVVRAQQASTDPAALMSTSEGVLTVFSVFVRATLPLARSDLACDNSDPQVAAVCLNAPLAPAAVPSDPAFRIVERDHPTVRISNTVILPGVAEGSRRTVRVTGTWFVQQVTETARPVQTLQLAYTNWQGAPEQAWLYRTSAGAYRFIGATADRSVDAATCLDRGICWDRDYIRYVGADGTARQASLEVAVAPVGVPVHLGRPVEGQPATVTANGFAPAHGVGKVTYSWQFQNDGCGDMACQSFSAAVTGKTATHVWQSGGRFQVRLTAVDEVGHTATTTLTVPVAGVPPVLKAGPPVPDTAVVDSQVTIGALIDHAGTSDSETVHLDWGDGTPTLTAGRGPGVMFLATPDLHVDPAPTDADATLLRVAGTHVYARPGTYRITLSVTDQAGYTDRLTQDIVVEPAAP